MLISIAALCGCAAMQGKPTIHTNAGAVPGPQLWLETISCVDNHPGRLTQGTEAMNLSHSPALPVPHTLADAICDELPAESWKPEPREVDSTYKVSAKLSDALAAFADSHGAKSLVVTTAGEHYANTTDDDGRPTEVFMYNDYAVFVFDRGGTAHYIARKPAGVNDSRENFDKMLGGATKLAQ